VERLSDAQVSSRSKNYGPAEPARTHQPTENELPQPHEDAALGLRTWK
jgi:hypothetical protein